MFLNPVPSIYGILKKKQKEKISLPGLNPWSYVQHPSQTFHKINDIGALKFLLKMLPLVPCIYILCQPPLQNKPIKYSKQYGKSISNVHYYMKYVY